MRPDDLDAQMVEAVRLAAADAKDPKQRARLSAAAAIFGALRKRDEREREAWAIVREVAVYPDASHACACPFCRALAPDYYPASHMRDCPVNRARALLASQ